MGDVDHDEKKNTGEEPKNIHPNPKMQLVELSLISASTNSDILLYVKDLASARLSVCPRRFQDDVPRAPNLIKCIVSPT